MNYLGCCVPNKGSHLILIQINTLSIKKKQRYSQVLNNIALIPYQYHCVVVFSCPIMAVMGRGGAVALMMMSIYQSIRDGCGFCWTLIVFRATHRMFAWFQWIWHGCGRLYGAIRMIVRLDWAASFRWWWWRWQCTLRIRWNILTLFVILLTIEEKMKVKEEEVYPILEIISNIFMWINYILLMWSNFLLF